MENTMVTGKHFCIDFDDTLCLKDDSVAPHAKEVLAGLKKAGHKITICSSRFNPKIWGELVETRINKVKQWLRENDIQFDEITAYKPSADVYIDDKGYRFEGNWEKALIDLKKILHL